MTFSRRPANNWKPRTQTQTTTIIETPKYAPSPYQQNIIDFVRTGTGNAIVQARAGSGKTSTLMMLDATIKQLGKSAIFCAFNSSIKDELVKRGANARTFHSLGFSAIGKALYGRNKGQRLNVQARKVSDIIDRLYGQLPDVAPAVERLVSLAKNHMLTPETATNDALISLISHFDIEWDSDRTDDEVCDMVRATLTENNKETVVIDFDDQLYFVFLFNARVETFDFVLVDESQDTNPLRRYLAQKMMHPQSRIIAVGDDRQAIYGFTGASHDSMDLIRDTFACKVLPLSISYRCARSIIELAQTIVPDIMPRDNAPEGSVLRPPSWKRSEFISTDLIICRNTAPIIQVAYKLIAARIPCKVMGREIGQGLINLIKRMSRKNETLESLSERLLTFKTEEVRKALAQKKETKAQAIDDKVSSILAIVDSMTPEDTDGGIPRLIAIITAIFEDKDEYGRPKGQVVTLSTVHKAKGMEAPRVFILDYNLMPSKYARQDWQVAQEHNLRYVAITRALDTLVFVESKKLVD